MLQSEAPVTLLVTGACGGEPADTRHKGEAGHFVPLTTLSFERDTMSERTIALKAGDTLTVAYVLQGDELATDKPKRKFCKRRKDESDESLAARKAELQANTPAPVVAPVAPVVPVVPVAPVVPVTPVATPVGSTLEKLIGPTTSVKAKPKAKTSLCQAVAIINYTSGNGKVSNVVLWKMGTNKNGEWFRMRWLDRNRKGFTTYRGFWGVKDRFNSIVAEGDGLKKLCGCEDCQS